MVFNPGNIIACDVSNLAILLDFHYCLLQAAVCGCSYLSALRREAGVPPEPSLQVIGALSVPTQVDGSGLDVDVHQVVDDPALDVILDPVDEEPPADIDHLDEGEIPEGTQANRMGWLIGLYRRLQMSWQRQRWSFTCRADRGPGVGSWFGSTRFSSGNPAWRRTCCSPGSLDTTPSLPAQGGRLSDNTPEAREMGALQVV